MTQACPFSWIQITKKSCFGEDSLVWQPQNCLQGTCKLWSQERLDCGLAYQSGQAPPSNKQVIKKEVFIAGVQYFRVDRLPSDAICMICGTGTKGGDLLFNQDLKGYVHESCAEKYSDDIIKTINNK